MNAISQFGLAEKSVAEPVRIIVNGVRQPLLVKTLEDLCPDPGAATALNGAFIPRGKRGTVQLQAGDEVEILVPVQGG